MTDSALKTALLSLSVENDNHWTKAGLPRLETLKFLTGDSSLTQEAVSSEIPGFNRAAATMPTTVVTEQPKVEADVEIASEIELSKEESMNLQLVYEQEKLELIRKKLIEVSKEFEIQEGICRRLSDKIFAEFGEEDNQEAISNYLKGQQNVLQERAAKQKLIAESGINLKELAENLKSPLDTALARKRRS